MDAQHPLVENLAAPDETLSLKKASATTVRLGDTTIGRLELQPGRQWSRHVRPVDSSAERTAALPDWLHTYNHHRGHTALRGRPPISRISVSDGAGRYTYPLMRRPCRRPRRGSAR